MNRLSRGQVLVGALSIDAQDITITDDLVVGDLSTLSSVAIGTNGTTIKKIVAGTVAVDLPSIGTLATGTATITVTGAAAGDIVVVNPPALTSGLAFSHAVVSSANTITVHVVNATAGSINEASGTWAYMLIDVT